LDSGKQRSGTYLPSVAKEQNWNKTQCIKSLIAKSGFKGKISQNLMEKLTVTKYESSTLSMTYEEYLSFSNKKK
jgi:AMME syndrome candidate gene 1 protein